MLDRQEHVLQVDPDKLGTALANLLTNAIRFSPPGGTIAITLLDLPARASIDIQDQGPGVAAADRERIFESFQQGRRGAQSEEGTGLGLTLCRRIVALRVDAELAAREHARDPLDKRKV